jgi:hypothetical protein
VGSFVCSNPLWHRFGYISGDEENFGLARHTSSITRRGVISAAAAASVLPVAAHAAPVWTKAAYETAMRESGRPVSLTDAQFEAIQKRKPAAMRLIESYLKERLGSADPAVLAAFQAVPREYYHYYYAEHRAMPGDAYEDNPKPWALGWGSAGTGRGHAGGRHRQRVPEQPAVADRGEVLLDRDYRAAGQGGGQDLRAARL